MKRMRYQVLSSAIILAVVLNSCDSMNNNSTTGTANTADVKLITLDPGHFHAALVQKEMYPGIDSEVYVYAPGGLELEAHLALIKQYNERPEHPTKWVEKVYKGSDYLEKMLSEKKGNVVVLAGNNRQKTEYINKAIEAGLNVLGDKPMAINFEFQFASEHICKSSRKKVITIRYHDGAF